MKCLLSKLMMCVSLSSERLFSNMVGFWCRFTFPFENRRDRRIELKSEP